MYFPAIQLLMNESRHFQKQKQNFKYNTIATKNIHSEEARECFKGYKIVEAFSPTASVSLTGLLKSCLNHIKTCPSLMSFLRKKKKKR